MKKVNVGRFISTVINRGNVGLFAALFLFSSLVLTSCKDEEVAKKYKVKVSVVMPQGVNKEEAKGLKVNIENTATAQKQTATTDTAGIATFSVNSGTYNISAVGRNDDLAFNGRLNEVTISKSQDLQLQMLSIKLTKGLVIKELYYTGSKTPEDENYYSDQFIEIYNNSDEVIYLDGLGIGTLKQSGIQPNPWVDTNGEFLPSLPLSFYTWYFPGTGKEHPLQPRTSVIVAQDGIDHKTDPKGNPNSPVNLGNADWEYYCGDVNGGKDADAAGVPNMSMMYTTATSMHDGLYPVFGPAVILFRLPQGTDPLDFAANPDNLMFKPGDQKKKKKYLMIPKEYVVDAVEGVRKEENKRHKRLHTELDAGYVFCSDSYNSKSIRRKVDVIIDGKVFYRDTNNSTEDFLADQDPTPGVHPTTID